MSENQDAIVGHPAPFVLNIPFGRNWGVVTPNVYRYEDQRWIDEFFNTGRLRLSSFAKFAKYPDESRGDTNEGSAFCYGAVPQNKCIGVFQTQGLASTILCCSHRLDRNLQAAFQRDSVFEIINTVLFATEIARQIAGFRQGHEGSCIYRPIRTIQRPLNIDPEFDKLPGDALDSLFDDATQALGGPELILLKEQKYDQQMEYRMWWELDALGNDFLDVEAPLAREHCRQVRASDY